MKNQTTCTEYIESTLSLGEHNTWYVKSFKKPSYFPSNPYISIELEVVSENTHATHKKPLPKSAEIPRKKKIEGQAGN